mmetsp:Transcript_23321/g.48778  ORF Transcript_23321/g.48778 Transcript_23321/m.48778 type:complete len:205 (+) Transcript_23321:519-1133(+)
MAFKVDVPRATRVSDWHWSSHLARTVSSNLSSFDVTNLLSCCCCCWSTTKFPPLNDEVGVVSSTSSSTSILSSASSSIPPPSCPSSSNRRSLLQLNATPSMLPRSTSICSEWTIWLNSDMINVIDFVMTRLRRVHVLDVCDGNSSMLSRSIEPRIVSSIKMGESFLSLFSTSSPLESLFLSGLCLLVKQDDLAHDRSQHSSKSS